MFKRGSRSDLRNYCPVAKLDIFAKILVNLVQDKLSINHIVVPKQYAFMLGRLTVSNLAKYFELILHALDEDYQVDLICTDFRAAFDLNNRDFLITMLRGMSYLWYAD